MQKINGNLDERKIVADMMTSYCESLPEKKSSEEVFSKWNPRSDSNTETPNRYLDQIVTDQSVTDILYTYFIPNTIPWSGVYDYMESEGLDGFFSRRSDGMYSKWATENHGFPSRRLDDDMNENQDINDVNEDQESDDENASVDENQNLKDFIVDDEEDSESDDDSYSERM